MPDATERFDEHGLPHWVGWELRRPVSTDPAARDRLMARVRAAAPQRLRALRPRPSAWRSRRGLASLGGLAAAAAFAGIVALGAAHGGLRPGTDELAAVWHDTIAGVTGASHIARGDEANMVAASPLAAGTRQDSIGAQLLRDTLRLVRFVLVAPTATRLALVGDFNAWDPRATPMIAVAESTGTWITTVALRAGAHRYAYVQDDTQWVSDPGAPRVSGPDGRVRSLITVPAVER